jgi:hypothetical protein
MISGIDSIIKDYEAENKGISTLQTNSILKKIESIQ